MVIDKAEDLDKFMEGVVARNPGEPEFHQAVHEVAMDIIPYMADKPLYKDLRILERMTEPDRVVIFRVCWEDDEGNVRVNRAPRSTRACSSSWPSNRYSRIHLPACLWAAAREGQISIRRAGPTVRLCVSANRS